MIHILQCVCPKRHAISAIFYDDAIIAPEEAMRGFQEVMALALEQKLLNPRCAICKAEVVFQFEDGATGFVTMVEAHEAGKQSEADQLATRRFLDSMRN